MSTAMVVLPVELIGGPLCGEILPVPGRVDGTVMTLPYHPVGFPGYRLTVRRDEVCYQWRE